MQKPYFIWKRHLPTHTLTLDHTHWTSLTVFVWVYTYVFHHLGQNTEPLVLRAASQQTEVGQRDFVRPRALVLSDTRLCYQHMTAWLMEHAQQIRTGLFGYSLPDRALTQGSTCVLLRVCWQVRDCSRAVRDEADWYNNMVMLSETTENKTLWFICWCNEERRDGGCYTLTSWFWTCVIFLLLSEVCLTSFRS